jgi:Skp family chaperone for outer membrane proteins
MPKTSRFGRIITWLALLLAALALIGQLTFLSEREISAEKLRELRTRVAKLESSAATKSPILVALLDADDAFTVFYSRVKDLRQRVANKRREIFNLYREHTTEEIAKEEYEIYSQQLRSELLEARLDIVMEVVEAMLDSSNLSDIHPDLERLRAEAQPVVNEVRELVKDSLMGKIEQQEYEFRSKALEDAVTQVDRLTTQAAACTIEQIAVQLAAANGYDLVLQAANAVFYRNTLKLVDITDRVKLKLASSLQ